MQVPLKANSPNEPLGSQIKLLMTSRSVFPHLMRDPCNEQPRQSLHGSRLGGREDRIERHRPFPGKQRFSGCLGTTELYELK